MNRCYRHVFNRKTGTCQVTSELSKSSSKGKSSGAVVLAGIAAVTFGLHSMAAFAADLNLDSMPTYVISGTIETYDAITVGINNPAALEVGNGGRLSGTLASYLGQNYGAIGTVTVQGTGSEWYQLNSIYIGGYSGKGILNIEDGGKVRVSSGIEMGAFAGPQGNILNLNNGGILELRYLVSTSGKGTVNIDGGILRALGNNSNFISGFGAGDIMLQGQGVEIDSNNYNVAINIPLSGAGGLKKSGTGKLSLNGVSQYTGLTDVTAGTLMIGADSTASGASIASDVTVRSAATLGGFGQINGSVNVENGGHLAPGNPGGTFTVNGNLTLAQGSNADFSFGAPGPNASTPGQGHSVQVNGNLAINGAILNTIDAGSFGPGLYNLFNYTGGLTLANGGIIPPAGGYTIQNLTSTKQINLVSTAGMDINIWNANGLASPSVMGGGNGIWSVNNANWSNIDGSVTSLRQPSNAFVIFGGASGTVTIDSSAGTPSTLGIQFASDGYHLNGDALMFEAPSVGQLSEIRVGNSSPSSENWIAVIDNTLIGTGFNKTGAGTLVLNGVNLYGDSTSISAGTLSVSSDANLGLTSAGINLSGGTLRITGTSFNNTARAFTVGAAGGAIEIADANNTLRVSQAITGNGSLTKLGSGTLAFAGANGYSGNTTIANGILRFDTYTQNAGQVLGIGARSSTDYGKLQVLGHASFNANARIDVDVATTNTLAVNQTLAGVVTAGSIQASTFDVSDNSALFNFRAVTNGNSIDLHIVSNSQTGMGVRDAVAENKLWSALGAAQVLDAQLNAGAGGDTGNVIDALGRLSNNRDVARATAQTLPLTSGNQAIQGTLGSFQRLVQNRSNGASGLSSGDTLPNKEAWARVFGSRAEQDDRNGTSGFSADSWGMAFGADAQIAPDARFGVAYGYAKTSVNGNTDLAGTAQRSNIDSHIVSAYGSKDIGNARSIAWQADIGMNDSKSTRHMEFGGLNRTATADYRTYSAHIGAAITQQIALSDKTTLSPGLRADYSWLKSQSYSETGANALNLNVASQKTDAFVLGADARLQHIFSPASRLDVSFGVGYDTINKRGNIVAAYAGAPGQSFITTGIDHSPWLARGGIAYVHTTTSGTEVTLRYDAEGRSDYLNQTASVRAKWAF